MRSKLQNIQLHSDQCSVHFIQKEAVMKLSRLQAKLLSVILKLGPSH